MLQDTYLDHAGLLNARGWSLRRREINGGEIGYTLKRGARTIGALHNREEVEALARNASGATSSSALPVEISDLIVGEFGAELTTQLQPTVTLTQQRRTWPLMHTGVTVAICSITKFSPRQMRGANLRLSSSRRSARSTLRSLRRRLTTRCVTSLESPPAPNRRPNVRAG